MGARDTIIVIRQSDAGKDKFMLVRDFLGLNYIKYRVYEK